MAVKKVFTDESLATFIDQIKNYTNNAVSAKANKSHTHSISEITDLQSALDGKAAFSHNHSASSITSGTLSSDRLPTVPISKGGTGATTASAALVNLGLTATASELNVLDGITANVTELNYLDGVNANVQTQLNNKLSLSGGTISNNLNVVNIFQNGRMFNNLATFNNNDTVNEIVIKTKIPFISGDSMPAISLKGYAYGASSPIELTISFYIYNNVFCNMGVTSVCPWNPDIYLSTYTENNTKYVAISLAKEIYYARFVVNMIDIWRYEHDYSKNWSIESKPKTTSGSIIPTTDKVGVPYKDLATNISGNASTATNATYATTAGSANSVAWGNVTGKSNATQSVSGLMSNTDKTKLDGIATGANKTTVDSSMSSSSTNPVQNKVVNSAISTSLTNAKTYTDTEISKITTTVNTKANSSDLTSHTGNKTNPHGVTLTQLGITATATELNKLDGITATVTELNYTDGVTSNIQTQLNNKSATGHTHSNIVTAGDNRSAATTPNTYNNNLIFQGLKSNSAIGSPSGDNYSYVVGLRGWSDKSGGNSHELAFNNSGIFTRNGADTSWSTWNKIYTSANKPTLSELGAAASSHNHAASNITSGTISSDRLPTVPISKGGTGATTAEVALTNLGLTATAAEINKLDGVTASTAEINKLKGLTATTTELNYTDGVTSNIQTQLDGKAASSHNHAAGNITSGTLSSDRLPTVPVAKGGTGSTTAAGARANLGTLSAINANGYYGMGLPDGTASNWIRTTQNGIIPYQSGGSGSLGTSSWPFNNAYINTVYGNLSGNATTATTATSANTLTTARTINLGTGVTATATSFNGGSNITIPVTGIKESYLSWGGRNLSGSVSPIDAASSNLHSANRFAFAKAAGITIEYSTNGSTYSAYSTTDSAKTNLVSGNGNAYYIGARSSSTTVNDKLRITLNATNMGVYTRLRKLLINISTGYSSGSNVIIEKAMKGSESTFSTVGTYSISGWSGWNSIPIECAFGGGATQTGNVAVLRLTFGITGVNSSQTANALTILDIIGIGDTYWSYPSTMAKTGHIYSYDSSQNTTFPAAVSASTYSGSGIATVAEVKNYLGIT